MVSKGQIGVGAVIAICAVAAGAMLYPTTDTMPGAEVAFDTNNSMIAKSMSMPSLHALISYHDYIIYEQTEFQVEVTDSLSNPIEGANVSFMIPEVYLFTNKEGSVFFSAPDIEDKYLAEANDTMATFQLTVTKQGYISAGKTIVVHIKKKSGIE